MTDLQYYPNLRAANTARQAEWDTDNKINIQFRAVELAGETGEALNILKKLVREEMGLGGSRSTPDALGEELADIAICIDLVGMDLKFEPIWQFNDTELESEYRNPLRIGNVLVGAIGHSCLKIANEHFDQEIFDKFTTVIFLCLALCEIYEIDFRKAIENKFNKTSEARNLKTRLGTQ